MISTAFFVLCAVLISVYANCTHPISCPCGSSGRNHTFCSDGDPNETDPCAKWEKCLTCQDGMPSCLACLPGYSGPTCSEGVGLKRTRKKRQTSPQIGSCPLLHTPASGSMTCRPARRRGTCTGSCHTGYTFEGRESEPSIILECRRNRWFPLSAFPRCVVGFVKADCLDPGAPPGVERYPPSRHFPGTFKEKDSVAFFCTDSEKVIRGTSVITCEPDGTWSAATPRCVLPEAKPCVFPGVDPNGQVFVRSTTQGQLDPNQSLPPGTRLIYSCNEGFERFGSSYITCLPSGEWSSFYPECISRDQGPDPGIYCADLGPIPNGNAVIQETLRTRIRDGTTEYVVGTVMQYSCEIGYAIQGSEELVCEDTGQWSARLPTCVEVCGVSTLEASTLITHGIKTLAGEWPWVVAISVVNRNNFTSMTCGGALLNRRTVLTAAHCVEPRRPYYVLHFGKYYRRVSMDGDEVLTRRSTKIFSHPNFDSVTFENDIALIRFSPTVEYSPVILPICLPTPESTAKNVVPDNEGYVTGWGETEKGTQADALMMAKLPVQSGSTCMRSFQKQNLDFQIIPSTFCAGFKEGVTSTCRGDSGSSLVFFDEEKMRYTVEGCVSNSARGSCGVRERYTVFTKVGHFHAWIRRNL